MCCFAFGRRKSSVMERKVTKLIRNILFSAIVIGNLEDSLAYTKGSTERFLTFPVETVSEPKLDKYYGCGRTSQITEDFVVTEITYENMQESFPHSEEKTFGIYHQNETAERLLSEGFDVSIKNMTNDAISHFTASNGTFRITYELLFFQGRGAAGGAPASRSRAYYMAQLGRSDGGKTTWLCDGVLINRQWILSAAHCFLTPGSEPNIVRLGDYDLNEESKFYDYEMAEIVFHPEFNLNARYHDLVLIRIPRKYPFYAATIYPICLPWDSLSNKNLVGYNVTLTGWGATYYGGPKTSLLQQVFLQVFPTSTCDKSYKTLSDFRSRYPNGLTENTIMCVGWNEDGKDACGGDSGAPIVYEPNPFTFVLAGIVSGGFGCGLNEYPGLYIPISKPIYLKWIKDVAFKEVY